MLDRSPALRLAPIAHDLDLYEAADPALFLAFRLRPFYCLFLSCLCTEDFLVHYVFSFTLRLENDQAVRDVDSSRPHTTSRGEAVTPQIHASHSETLPLCFIDGHAIPNLQWELQSLALKVVVWRYQRNAGNEDSFALADAREYCTESSPVDWYHCTTLMD